MWVGHYIDDFVTIGPAGTEVCGSNLRHLKGTCGRLGMPGIRHRQIMDGGSDPKWGTMPKLQLVLKGIQRGQAEAGRTRPARSPVTPELLRILKRAWTSGREPEGDMLWAATCLCFFGCLRAGELTMPAGGQFNPRNHLGPRVVTVDGDTPPKWISVRIKRSKTDQFRKGATVTVGLSGQTLCPVQALLKYMARRGNEEGPLFRLRNGHPLTRARLDGALKKALQGAGSIAACISTHSLRIGAATTAARRGVEDSAIKDLGRWKSRAYLGYICRTEADRARTTAVLAKLDGN